MKRIANSSSALPRPEMAPRARRNDQPSLHELGARRLTALCTAPELASQRERCLELFARLTDPWGAAPIDVGPPWPSVVGDDHTPFEFSISFGDPVAIRMLVEPLGLVPSVHANRQTARALLRSMEREFELQLNRLDIISDLFLPTEPGGPSVLCIAVACALGREPQFRVYFDVEAQGSGRAPALVEEALVRLGFRHSWPLVSRGLRGRGTQLDRLKYFSLDLTGSRRSRVKIYARHQACSRDDLLAAASLAPAHYGPRLVRFLRLIVPDTECFTLRSPLTCYAFVEGDNHFPTSVTTHIPVNSYALDDATVEQRVRSVLDGMGAAQDVYSRALRAYAEPEGGGGRAQSYVSLVQERGESRVTVYLAAEAFASGMVADPPRRLERGSASRMVEWFENEQRVLDHPLLNRLRREPVDLHVLWILLANLQISISRQFAQWLALVASRVEDGRIRCLLAEHLYEEMGSGCFERAHANLFSHMMSQLERWRSPDRDGVLLPGRKLAERLGLLYQATDVNVALGAIIAGEVFAKQLDRVLAEQFRRQTDVPIEGLQWLVLHESLEVDHAEEAATMAALIADRDSDAIWEGAFELFDASSASMDDVYEVAYGPRSRP